MTVPDSRGGGSSSSNSSSIPDPAVRGEIRRIRDLSSRIDARLSRAGIRRRDAIDGLTPEQLQDLDQVVCMADYMLCKHADSREMRSILKHLVGVISEAAGSIGQLDDEIAELIVSAEASIGRVRRLHGRLSDQSDMRPPFDDGPEYDRHATSAINLTNPVGDVHPVAYQQNRKDNHR